MKIHVGFLLLVLPAVVAGCDNAVTGPTSTATRAAQSGPLPQPEPIPPPPPGTVRTTNSVPASNNGVAGFYKLDVAMSATGTATVTLRWPNADVSLQLYLTSVVCSSVTDLLAGACPSRVVAPRPGSPPLVLTSPVMSGDLSIVWVINPDPVSQEVTVDIAIEERATDRGGGYLPGRSIKTMSEF